MHLRKAPVAALSHHPGYFASGLSHGSTTNGPVKGWKFHLPLPANHSAISSGRSSAGIRLWIGDINDEAVVVSWPRQPPTITNRTSRLDVNLTPPTP